MLTCYYSEVEKIFLKKLIQIMSTLSNGLHPIHLRPMRQCVEALPVPGAVPNTTGTQIFKQKCL